MYLPSPEERVERLRISDRNWMQGITCVQFQPFWDECLETLIHEPGLYHHVLKKVGRDLRCVSTRLSGLIVVDACIADEESGKKAVLLRCGRDIEQIIWLGDLVEIRSKALRSIADAGVWISLKGQDQVLISEWLMSEALTPPRQVLLYRKTGWHQGTFRLPHVAYGVNITSLVPSQDLRNVGYAMAGTLDEWRESVGKTLKGNPAVIFAVGVALSGVLIDPAGGEGGGFHLFGESGKGKSTILDVAVSIWGGADFKKSWASTANGKFSLYGALNGTCVVMDELHESPDPRAISREIYALNGTPKTRGRPTGGTTSALVYKVAFLSSGESSIPDFLAAHKLPTLMTGAAKRLISIEVTNRQHGVFDDTHGMSPKTLSDSIKSATQHFYGTAGPAFAEMLVRELSRNHDFARNALVGVMTQFSGDDDRVARRFALAALAIELAVSCGIVPLNSGDGLCAATVFFEQWKARREPDMEPQDAIWEYITQHGCYAAKPNDEYAKWGGVPIYLKRLHGQSHWLLPSKTLKHALGGRWSLSDATNKLTKCGWLIGGRSKMQHITTLGHSDRVYEIVIPEGYEPEIAGDCRPDPPVDQDLQTIECVVASPSKDGFADHEFLGWATEMSQRDSAMRDESDHESGVSAALSFDEVDAPCGAPESPDGEDQSEIVVGELDIPAGMPLLTMDDVITKSLMSGGDPW